MNDVTRILSAVKPGDPTVAEQLLPLVYNELRKLAAVQLARLGPGQSLAPTGLVHEAYLRLVDTERVQDWNSRGHFFVAAAEAMRRILVERARRRRCKKRGGDLVRRDIQETEIPAPQPSEDLLALDEALAKLEAIRPEAARLVMLRHFSGLTKDQAAEVMGISPRTADRLWSYARAWLLREIQRSDAE
jgi:RNA polymerase sigma factor (TIGR02999 family)